MSEQVSSTKAAKAARAATVEDYDEEKGEADPATRKTAKSHRPANSASKRANKSPELHQDPPRLPRRVASDSGHSQNSRDSGKAKLPKRTAQPAQEDAQSSARRPSIRKNPSRNSRPRSPGKKPSKEARNRSPEKRSSRDEFGCDCDECMAPRFEHRPGPALLPQGYHASPHPYGPYAASPPPIVHHEPYPPGYVSVPRPRTGSFVGGRPTSFHQGIIPGFRAQGSYLPGGGYFDHAPPAQMGTEPRAFNPRIQVQHRSMTAHPSQPGMVPPPRTHPSPVTLPSRPKSRPNLGRQSESYPARDSNPQFTTKISTYDPLTRKGFDDEHISAREAPPRRRAMPGQFELSECSESSPERGPPLAPPPPQPSRPPLKHNSTTSEVHQIHGGRDRANSGATRYPLFERRPEHRRDYPPESITVRSNRGSEYQYPRSWDRHSDRDLREYEKYEGQRQSSRRDSIASGQTQPTSYSNPEQRFMGGPRPEQRDSYVPPEPRDIYQRREDDIRAYQDSTRGYPETRMNADTLRAVDGARPQSNLSYHSHRSRHSISESQYTRTGDGGIRIRVAQGSAIAFGDDMADRQIQVRSSADPGQVELFVGGSNRDTRYNQSTGSASRSAVPSHVSSGSTRHATRGENESRDQVQEDQTRHSRAPSLKH